MSASPFSPSPVRPTFKIAVVSTKGGVGKSTTCAHLAALLADMGYRVLLLDADPQPTLSKYFPITRLAPYGLTKIFDDRTITEDMISSTEIANLDIIVSDDPHNKIQPWLSHEVDRAVRIRDALKEPAVQDAYDFVIMDTQGAKGALQESAAWAADIMLTPVVPQTLAAREFLTGTKELIQRLMRGTAIGLAPGHMYAFLIMQERLRDSTAIAQSIRREFVNLGGRVTMLKASVPESKIFLEAATRRTPVHRLDPSWIPMQTDDQGRILRNGSGAYIMHQFLWELIPALEGFCAPGVEAASTDHEPSSEASSESTSPSQAASTLNSAEEETQNG